MGVVLLIGSVFVAYCLPFSLFVLMIARRAQLVIVLLTAAFFYLIGVFISSILYSIITPLSTSPSGLIVVSVIFTEIVRLAFLRMYAKSERSFSVVSMNAVSFPLIDLYSSIAAGVGFGSMHSVLLYSPVFAAALEPGTFFLSTCPSLSSSVVSAWLSLFFYLIHISLFIVAFDAFRQRSIMNYLVVIAVDLASNLFTLINTVDDGCKITLPLLAAVAVISSVFAAFVMHSPNYRSKRRL